MANTFQEEYRATLELHDIKFDERYVEMNEGVERRYATDSSSIDSVA